jgi:predicted kinase
MKQVLIILRGAPCSGKTTLGEKLRDFDKKIVWFKTDNIKPFFSNFEDRTLDAVMGTSLATLNYLLDEGYSVVYDGILKKPEYAQRAIDLTKSKNIPIAIYQLVCSLKTLQGRDKDREGVKEGLRKPLGDGIIEECLEIIRKNFD